MTMNTPETQLKSEPPVRSMPLLDDTARINWLNQNGRVAKFNDGWNAWSTTEPRKSLCVETDIRKAIDGAMEMSSNDPS